MAVRKKKTRQASESKWNIGVYCRLSSDDGDNAESDSIKNQRELITFYLKDEENANIVDYYIDDGVSGTSFNRKGFQTMIKDIYNKKINTVIVKDLSRFGRNYIDVGHYLEHIFPINNVRFIAINDNIDSYKKPETISSIIVPFKNILNDEYARDISNKVKSVLQTKSKKGEFVGGTTPYGYKKNPENIYQLIIDEQEAKIVKLIYEKALNGEGQLKICKYLNDNNILCRKEVQRRNKYKLSLDDTNIERKYNWSKTTINNVLTNETYIGNLVYNRTGSISYKDHRQVSKPKNEWIIVKNTHQGIITKEEFNKVKKMVSDRASAKKREPKLSIYGWKIKCGDCGHAMCRMEDYRKKKVYSHYYCRQYKTQTSTCTPHKIETSHLNKVLMESIMTQIKMVMNLEKALKKIENNKTLVNHEQEYNNSKNKVLNEIEKMKKLKKVSYEDWKFQKITKDEYMSYAKDYDERIENYNKQIKLIETNYIETQKNYKKDDYWIERFRRNKKIKELSKDIIDELIECIYIHENSVVTIKFKYQDEYESALKMLEEMEEQ